MQKKANTQGQKEARKWLFYALSSSVSVLLMLAILEVTLRLLWPQIFLPHPQGMYSRDDDIGYVLTPDFDGEFRGAEFRVSVRTNNTGLRGIDLRPLAKNSVRILCLGDSFTWGWGVNDNETYPAELEKLLQIRYPRLDVQVLNAGVSGYGTDEELEFLKKRGADLKPDIVISQFFSGNDFDDNRHAASRSTEIRDGMLFQIHQTVSQQQPAWLKTVNWLKQRSHLAHMVSNRIGYLAMGLGLLDELERPLSKYFTEEDGRRATDHLIEISKVAHNLGARMLFVFVPEKIQVLSRPQDPLRAAALVQEAAMIADVPSIDLTPELVKTENLDKLYFVQDAHWTSKGHKWMAQILSEGIGDLSLVHTENEKWPLATRSGHQTTDP